MHECVLCHDVTGKLVTVRKKGRDGLIKASQQRRDGKESIFSAQKFQVHESCRKTYTAPFNILKAASRTEIPLTGAPTSPRADIFKLRSTFTCTLKDKCVLCYENVSTEHNTKQAKQPKSRQKKISKVTTHQFRETLISCATERGDAWGSKVLKRCHSNPDFVAAHVVYHKKCLPIFCKKYVSHAKGRPKSKNIQSAMEQIYYHLENNEECQFKLTELEKLVEGPGPSLQTIKHKLKQKYGDKILITKPVGGRGGTPIVCFRGSGNKILTDAWYNNRAATKEDEENRIIRTAAEIILEQIRSTAYDLDTYPSCVDFFQNAPDQVPPLLQMFLKTVITGGKAYPEKYEKKCTAIAHSIVAATRPRSFNSAILIGNAVYLNHKLESRDVVTLFSKLGYSASYADCQTYIKSAISQSEEKILIDSFVQFSFDNADFNAITLDGLNTMHVMGGIQCITPGRYVLPQSTIKKVKKNIKQEEVADLCKINIQTFEPRTEIEKNLGAIKLENLDNLIPCDLRTSEIMDLSDVLWFSAKLIDAKIGGWNGFMRILNQNGSYEVSHISYLPFINLPATNVDCIYTALMIAQEKTLPLNQTTTILTFDQPLYTKALEIVYQSNLSNIIIRLGGFHTLMSFLGAIGQIMDGSGLRELLSLIYAPLSVDKMLSGHSYARALRGHMLMHEALAKIMFSEVIFSMQDSTEILQLIAGAVNNVIQSQHVQSNKVLATIAQKFQNEMQKKAELGPTAELWVNYFKMVTLVKNFIKSERLGDWKLHLLCIKGMIPYFHASGHNNYAKNAHIYLQHMCHLEQTMPKAEYDKFVNGFFTIRRSDRLWNGVWSDLTIEQTLMRSMKSKGGLVHGRSTSENAKSKWILSATINSEVCQSMEKFANMATYSSEQHIDFRDSRIERDKKDVQKLVEYLIDHSPFVHYQKTMSISSGIVGTSAVNCHKAHDVGQQLLQSVYGTNIQDVKIKRNSKVVSLTKDSHKCAAGDEVINIDPLAILKRLPILSYSDKELEDVFSHELTAYPPALFNKSTFRKNQKSSFRTLFTQSDINLDNSINNSFYVIDGGFLLRRVVWTPNQSMQQICSRYFDYIEKHYGKNVLVVFDGYNSMSLKSAERRRRYTKSSNDVNLTIKTVISTTPDIFFGNENNKTKFIEILSKYLDDQDLETASAVDDADHIMINLALKKDKLTKSVVIVVGEDIDLLVLLKALTPQSQVLYFLKPGRGKKENEIYSSETSLQIKRLLLFFHAFTGCDSTSSFFQKGKISSFKFFKNNYGLLRNDIAIFRNSKSTEEEIFEAGKRIVLKFYNAPLEIDCVNKLRYHQYKSQFLNKNRDCDLKFLCPSEGAVEQHLKRVYLQVQTWLGGRVDPLKFGWKVIEDVLYPVTNLKPCAPDFVLNTIFCKCKKECSKKCTCKTLGLSCTRSCKNCDGRLCVPLILPSSDDEEDGID